MNESKEDKEPKEEQKDDTETTEEQKDKPPQSSSPTLINEKKERGEDEGENSDLGSSDNNLSKHKLTKDEKKKEKKEKKERKLLRKEMKSNPQFSFIEKDEKPPKEKLQKKSKKTKIEDTFNFTKENKYLGNDSPVNSGGEENEPISPTMRKKTPVVERSVDLDKKKTKRNKELEEHQIKKKKELLESFLLSHPIVKLKGTTWNYLFLNDITTGNEKKETMLFMVGGGLRMEAFFEQLLELQKDFKIIAPYVPHELKEFDDYVAGINLILSHHKVKKVHLYGITFGGMICQYYLSKYPEKVLSAIFSHVSPPSPDFGSLCSKFQIKKYERAPSALRRCLLGLNLKEKDFKRDIPYVSDEAVHFWLKRIKRFSAQEEDILSRISALTDYNSNVVYTPQTFEKLEIPILIIDSERTEEFGKWSYSEMQKLFPKATLQFLEGHGHLQIVVNQEIISQNIGKWYVKNYWDKGLGL